jgi:hypothetical protein
MSAGAAFVGLGESESAETQATTALQLFSEVPEADRWVAGELAARVDLATARALRNEVILISTTYLDTSIAALTRWRLDEAHARIDRGERPAWPSSISSAGWSPWCYGTPDWCGVR